MLAKEMRYSAVVASHSPPALTKKLERAPKYSWRGAFEGTRRLVGLLIRVQLVLANRPSVEVGLAAISFARSVLYMVRKSSLLTTALYLKLCSVVLQRYYGPVIREKVSVAISLTRTGLPRIIPKYHRQVIRRRDDRSDRIVQLYLSGFTLALIKIVELANHKGIF